MGGRTTYIWRNSRGLEELWTLSLAKKKKKKEHFHLYFNDIIGKQNNIIEMQTYVCKYICIYVYFN
jgi:hypothetical protein